ncbi:hypothetical protein PEPCOX59622_00348 [Aedoeadaptatus coxii]|uniref:hypothetical protein n=1 Tax=Aedoeadaptatus coxii TaxID=755172 RepID=UPI00177071D0|nr:hypothetical protein [Peptoniphilus coxii]CAC9928216.1 hypothetical protein PEPCOX59622_00348 [Peptoniphilus coxii]
MKYYVIEGKFKNFQFSLEEEENRELRTAFESFVKKGMDEGHILMMGGRAHGILGIGKGEHLDDMLQKFEGDPLTLADVIEYRMVEMEEPAISEMAEDFFK